MSVFDDHKNECTGEEDGEHHMAIWVDFLPNENDEYVAAQVETHIHHVPPQEAAATLLMLAMKVIRDGLGDTLFEGAPASVRGTLLHGAAFAYVKDLLTKVGSVSNMAVDIPDDVSSLLDGD